MNQPLHALAYVLTPYYYLESWLTSFSPTREKMKKPHDYQHSQTTYFEVVDRLVRDPEEAYLVRQKLNDFVSGKSIFGRPQAIKDTEKSVYSNMVGFVWSYRT